MQTDAFSYCKPLLIHFIYIESWISPSLPWFILHSWAHIPLFLLSHSFSLIALFRNLISLLRASMMPCTSLGHLSNSLWFRCILASALVGKPPLVSGTLSCPFLSSTETLWSGIIYWFGEGRRSVLCTYKFSLLSATKGMIFVKYGVLAKNMGFRVREFAT